MSESTPQEEFDEILRKDREATSTLPEYFRKRSEEVTRRYLEDHAARAYRARAKRRKGTKS